MIKGGSHHVMPYNSGWCVMNELNRRVIAHFDDLEKAMAYAQACAQGNEGSVLLHQTALNGDNGLSTVDLPQQSDLSDFAHQSSPNHAQPKDYHLESPAPDDADIGEFDPLLGFDEYYFEI